MLFNSSEFIFAFLPIAVIGHWILSRLNNAKIALLWLILLSLAFYAWAKPIFLLVLTGSALCNYLFIRLFLRKGGIFRKPGFRRLLLLFSLGVNIVLLGYFKYFSFIINTINGIMGWTLEATAIQQPLGISFFTIIQIMFLIDAFDDGEEVPSISGYGLFAVFFPYILSGPLVQARDMMPQFTDAGKRVPQTEDLARGIARFCVGLFKKAVIADTLAVWVETGFAGDIRLGFLEAWVLAFCYTLQLYFDFSGYTDMAIGSGRMLGFRLPENFNAPYRATSVIDFWRRWHITLSFFITSYVYMPLVRAFPGVNRAYSMLAIFLAMLVSGLWHGANWTFIIWGAMHGGALVVNHLSNGFKWKLPSGIAWLLTFLFVTLAFVCFRASSWEQASAIYGAMFGANGIILPLAWKASLAGILGTHVSFGTWLGHIGAAEPHRLLIWLTGTFLISVFFFTSEELSEKLHPTVESALGIAVCGVLGLSYMFGGSGISKFLYFQF